MIEPIGRSKSTTLMLVCLHALPALTVSIVREEGGNSDAALVQSTNAQPMHVRTGCPKVTVMVWTANIFVISHCMGESF